MQHALIRARMRGMALGALVAIAILGAPATAWAADGEGARDASFSDSPAFETSDLGAGEGGAALQVTTPTQAEIRAFLASCAADPAAAATFEQAPSAVSPYRYGTMSATSQRNGLALLNWARFIAGIPADVQADERASFNAQAAALLCAASGSVTPVPVPPAGMSGDMFNASSAAFATSVVSYGAANPADAVMLWLAGSDEESVLQLGHRRWCLDPALASTGLGRVDGFDALYVAGSRDADAPRYEAVVWPAAQMPTALFGVDEFWSVSTDVAALGSDVRVTVKRQRDGKTWSFSQGDPNGELFVSTKDYGSGDCLIFRPEGVGDYQAGDRFSVTVAGAAKTISYTVEFFDLYAPDCATLAGEGGTTASAVSLRVGEPSCWVEAVPSSAAAGSQAGAAWFARKDALGVTATWASSDPSVVSVAPWGGHGQVHPGTQGTSDPADWFCTLTPQGAGSATVTCTLSNGVRVGAAVTVDRQRGHWVSQGGRWWYDNEDGTYATSWKKIDGTWYYFDASGWMQTGWQLQNGTWYYLRGSGAMAEGWLSLGGAWYYLTPGSGAMATGWAHVDGTWYHLSDGGAMDAGWLSDRGTWYYLHGSGAMAEGWARVGGSWYYLRPGSGAMATGWLSLNGTWYYLIPGSGAMAASTWVGPYHVNASGAWDATR